MPDTLADLLLVMGQRGVTLDPALLTRLERVGVKTYAYFASMLRGRVIALYNGQIGHDGFMAGLRDLIGQQLTEAWRAGITNAGYDPAEEMSPELWAELNDIIVNEYSYMAGFANAIVAGADEGASLDGLLARSELWANRYNDVVNEASIVVAGKDNHVWQVGATDNHCKHCAGLNGIVATGNEWKNAGIQPQSGDLECEGWRCKCKLTPTDKRRSPNALNRIRAVMGKGK